MNSSGKVERTFRYGPYGENTKSEGTQTIPYPFGFKGGYRMPGGNKGEGNVTNGLIHYGQRYYDPTTGRWTQQDPEDRLGSATQGDRFLFAGSDPINLSDPSGLHSGTGYYVVAAATVAGAGACFASGAGAVLAGVCGGVAGYIADELFEPEEASGSEGEEEGEDCEHERERQEKAWLMVVLPIAAL